MIPAPEPPSPSQEVPTENLLDVSVERLDELLMRPHQDHQEPSQPRVEELDPAVGGMEDLQGVLTAVRARLVSALECHLAQRSRLSCVATQTDTPVRGFDDHLERTPLPSTGDEDECMQVDVEDDDREGAQEVVQRRSQETQVCLVKVQLQHDDEHNQRVALQRSQGTQADNGPQRDPIAHHLQFSVHPGPGAARSGQAQPIANRDGPRITSPMVRRRAYLPLSPKSTKSLDPAAVLSRAVHSSASFGRGQRRAKEPAEDPAEAQSPGHHGTAVH
ncbi:hypothetical protein FOCC_FOCC012171 [Frankliniella occidentalis]|nr:hypothetical protein FOCC_FOCC012171 [Frankliniella occidentalis]